MKNRIFLFAMTLCMGSIASAQLKGAGNLEWAIENFLWNDFGSIHKQSLETHTMPSKVALTSLVLLGREKNWIPQDSTRYQDVLKRFGFQQPRSVEGNSKISVDRFEDLPMGLVERKVSLGFPGISVTGLNVSCAACHGGHSYDSKGRPSDHAWPGLPNTSLNLEAYTQSLTEGLNLYRRDLDGSHQLMLKIFPKLSKTERFTLKNFVYPIIEERLEKIAIQGGRALPFLNGSPGLTNGVSALKMMAGIGNSDRQEDESGFTSIPPLGDRFFRSSLLYDGSYAPTLGKNRFMEKNGWSQADVKNLSQIVALFTIPSMGQPSSRALMQTALAEQILRPLISNYQAPVFPGDIDAGKSLRGEAIYQQNCAQCHGTYSSEGGRPRLVKFPNRLSPQSEMGTDPKRWQAITPEIEKYMNSNPTGKVVRVKNTGGYVAPLLNSLWATAPYLHNGSVPSLWALMNPTERPRQFWVGGHHLDLTVVGISHPAGSRPESTPVLYETTRPGQSNQGHEFPFDRLTSDEKWDLIEYLKLL
ncbi:MAG: cytochrome c [Bdellovibrionaceae bacterium]|nr:cytochrome c [Pseudobdellovibrionaceae bacterium]